MPMAERMMRLLSNTVRSSPAMPALRSQRSGTFVQNIFHGEAGTVEQYHGPQQIQYALG